MSSDHNPPASLRLHQFAGLAPGPRLIVLGAVHGNETCGTRAIERLLALLDKGELQVARGVLSLVPITNPLAYRLGQRQGDRNLNRNMRPNASPNDFEDKVATVVCTWLQAHDVLLDLHSFHTGGQPFALVGPRDNDGDVEPFAHAADEERLAAHLGSRRIVEGWMDAYGRGVARRRAMARPGVPPTLLELDYGVGTTEYMRRQGGYGVTLECGQHDDPKAPDVGFHAIMQALSVLGLIDRSPESPITDPDVLRLVDVVDLEDAADRFTRGWASFDPVRRGETIGVRHDGREVNAPDDGFVVFPNPLALPGNEWFYFAQRSERRF